MQVKTAKARSGTQQKRLAGAHLHAVKQSRRGKAEERDARDKREAESPAQTQTPPTPERYVAMKSDNAMDRDPVTLPGGVIAQDFNWGAIFTGTKAQLIKAGLAEKGAFGKYRQSKQPEFWLPLNWGMGYDDACYFVHGGKTDRIPQRWDARLCREIGGSGWAVYVKFENVRDLNVQQRANIALAALDAGEPNARELVAQIPPCPLSVAVPALIAELNRKYDPKAWSIGNEPMLQAMDGWERSIYAMDDICRRFDRSPLSLITTRETLRALAGRLHQQIMATGPHPKLKEALSALDGIYPPFLKADDGEGNLHAAVSAKLLGEQGRKMVVKAAQEIERFEILCGAEEGTGGYLQSPDSDPARVEK